MFSNRNIIILFFLIPTFYLAQKTDTIKNKEEKDYYTVFFYNQNLFNSLQPGGWKNFASSYNLITNPVEPLGNFRNKFSFDFGIKTVTDFGSITITYQRLYRTCSAKFAFDEERIFEFRNNSGSLVYNIHLLKIKQKFILSLTPGVRLGGDKILTAKYKYRDGFVSYGSELRLNGVYNGLLVIGSEIGLNLHYKLKRLVIESNLTVQANSFVSPPDYTDLSYFKSINRGQYTPPMFPSDYAAFNNTTNYDYPALKSKMSGYKLTIGIGYAF